MVVSGISKPEIGFRVEKKWPIGCQNHIFVAVEKKSDFEGDPLKPPKYGVCNTTFSAGLIFIHELGHALALKQLGYEVGPVSVPFLPTPRFVQLVWASTNMTFLLMFHHYLSFWFTRAELGS